MIPALVLLGELCASPQIIPNYEKYPIEFKIPILVGGLLGAGSASVLVLASKAEGEKMKIRSEELGVKNEELGVKNEKLAFYDWDNLENEASGVLIIGNSGSAKTSLACWLAGQLTKNKPAQVLALDPHANRNPLWRELNVRVFSDFTLIERQLELFEDLLDQRRNPDYQPKENDRLIILTDELGACIKNFTNSDRVQRTLERLGSEGRKYDIMLIAMNQSSNVEDIGISAQNRNNFVIIMTGASSRNYAELKWKKEDQRRQWIESQAYPCVLGGAVQATVAKHPTHGCYKEFKKKGNQPIGICSIKQLPLIIPVETSNQQQELSLEAKRLLEWFRRKSASNSLKFKLRDIQRGLPLGRNENHRSENINPLLKELLDLNLVVKDKDENYQILKVTSSV
ncbi:MAG: ATP-binding protein [Cyanobacteria bacterium P01_A01_bin.68]